MRTQAMNSRLQQITIEEFKQLLAIKAIRPASLEDVHGTHHRRMLYKHPNTGAYYVAVSHKRDAARGD